MKFTASLVVLLVCPGVFASSSEPRTLSSAQRVNAQAAIERVYYAHQVGATKPFEDAVPPEVLEAKVRKYLKQTAALSAFWKTPVTDEMLQRELERMALGTRMPERLLELYAALGNDSFLVKECLARPALVDRLTRNFYAFDSAMHDQVRQRAEALQAQLGSGALSPSSYNPDRIVIDLIVDATATDADPVVAGQPVPLRLAPVEFQQRRSELPAIAGQVSEIRETRDAFTFGVVLSETAASARVARYLVPKTSWDAWWAEASGVLHADAVSAVASEGAALPPPNLGLASASACSGADVWDNGALGGKTKPATSRAAVWTGSVMVIWGGYDGSDIAFTNGGGRYDPATDTWTPTSTTGAPSVRMSATAVWTGNLMVVWGGYLYENTGGRYDPVSDTWLSTSTVGAPSPRYRHTAVWTGSAMVVWGGMDDGGNALATGGRYDPAADSWTPTSPANAPSSRFDHTAVWSGTSMLVWGGAASLPTNSGRRYDPATDIWTTMSTVGAPSARSQHSAVWSGSAMLVWGGDDGSAELNTGGRYNPVADAWAPMATSGAPTTRSRHTAIWTGSRMIVWGGSIEFPSTNTGGRYDPATNTWTATSTAGAPSARNDHNAVWTGSLMVIVGGQNNAAIPNTGGRYDPSNDTWTPTALFGDPPPLTSQTAVWTGSLMVVWGGSDNFTPYLNTGGRYDPATDSWTTTTTTGAPTARFSHTAVWTGNVMIVWGGGPDNALAGGRYDPLTDSWLPTSTTGAPFERELHSAVWTGTSMIVWGGTNSSSGNHTATGGRYDPLTDTWTPTSTIGAPFQRVDHTAVWTGSEMIVWGGYTGVDVTPLNTGGRYNPATNSWAPTSIVNVPSARWAHPAVWTGTRMIVWSGAGSGGPSNTGGLYDPSGDTWSPTSTSGAPVARHEHSAVWTGDVMVNWGGFTGSGDILNSGGRYDPATDSWNPTSTAGAPKLNLHTEVWTGNMMIVWGGNEGGRYVIGSGCDDGNPCTDDSCDQAAGCGHTNNTNACNDGSACTTADVCSGGVCVGGAETNCDDGNACTTDSCDPATGCVVTNNTDPCTDGNACTTGDACGGGACVGGAPVTCAPPDQCHEDGTCDLANGACSYANKPDGTTCDDGDSNTTGDACQSGICMGGASCDTTPKPKPYGYYKKLCKDGHGHPNTHEDVLTDADAACVAALTDTFAGISTVEDLCAVLESSGGSGDGHDSKECVKGEQELMTTALNVCRQRICLTQEIDSQCAPGPHVLTTVQDSLDTADDILSDPGRNKNVCSDARCLVKEANNGHGIHHTSLLLNKESGNKVRLTWASPVMEDGSGEATGYTIWRRELHSPMPFTQIGATDSSALTCADTTAGNWEYEVTFTIEP